jgi:uncharacterized RDD family membrane protein YckC
VAEEPEGTQDQAPPAGAEAAPPVKADIGKRLIAAIIDAVIAVAIGFIPFIGGLIATAYWLVRDGLDIDFMDHRSVGKKLVKLRPVTLDGSPVDLMTSVKRNWMFALGGVAQLLAFTIIGLLLAIPLAFLVFLIAIVEVVLVLTDAEGRRLGDKIANTIVIEVDD